MQPAETTTIFQKKKIAICWRLNFFAYSSFDELVYRFPFSNAVMLDEELDETELPTGTALVLFRDVCLWGLLAAGLFPSSASLFIRFMIVGTNLVAKEMTPGSWKQEKEEIRLPYNTKNWINGWQDQNNSALKVLRVSHIVTFEIFAFLILFVII